MPSVPRPPAPESSLLERRAFVRQALSAGMSLSTVAALLQGCLPAPRVSDEKPDDPLPPLEKTLAIYNWSDDIAPETVPDFEREFGVKVSYDVYESNEELFAKLQTGASEYDLVFPSSYIVEVLIATGLAGPVHRQYLTNYGNLSPLFLDRAFDRGNRHSVPWQWGVTGFAYRKDKIAGVPDSWGILQDAQYRGKMTQMDDGRDVLGSWLRYRGHSLNSVNEAELFAARDDAIRAKANLKAYISAPVKAQLISGDVWLAQLWNGDARQAMAEDPRIDYVVPKEGCTIWLDSMVVPAGAPHRRAAHEFINYVLRPEVGAKIARAHGYGTPNVPAAALVPDGVPYPSDDEMKRLEYQVDLGHATPLWDQLWTEIKSA